MEEEVCQVCKSEDCTCDELYEESKEQPIYNNKRNYNECDD